MCVSQIKPVTQLRLSSLFDNVKFWNVKTAFRTKFPFLLPAVMTSLKSCRPYCSDLSRSGAFDCYFLPVIPTFTWEGRTHSRPPHVKDLFSRQRKTFFNWDCAHTRCVTKANISSTATIYCHLRSPDIDTWIIATSLFRPPIIFVKKCSYANRGW